MNQSLDSLVFKLFTIHRSITGDGLVNSAELLSRYFNIPILIHSVASGKMIESWQIPEEWTFTRAVLMNTNGQILIDSNNNNIHVLAYSLGKKGLITKNELFEHLHSDPLKPNSIPYRTSYYEKRWGLCVQHNFLKSLKEENYFIDIDAEHKKGKLQFITATLEGETDREILITCYLCHPQMAVNELSGALTAFWLLSKLSQLLDRKYTYKLVCVPETIGTICYLDSLKKEELEKIIGVFNVHMTGLRDAPLFIRAPRRTNTAIERCARANADSNIRFEKWSPIAGGEQRQYCSIGVNLPAIMISRAHDGSYPEYHTSDDDLSLFSLDKIEETVQFLLATINSIEKTPIFKSTHEKYEPFLTRYKLYPTLSGNTHGEKMRDIMTVMGYSDGYTDLSSIASISNRNISDLIDAAEKLTNCGLLMRW